ncbi:hypothetical protein BHM03_00051382 [Ensete ventricosum]|nr:hypothetical protein BHM03_00051382 [Ensete ventricosum]
MKKCDGHKLCVESSFKRFFVHRLGNSKYWSFPVEFRSVFRAPSQKFKILAVPDILAHESSFNRFFMHCLGNRTSTVSRKNAMVINFRKVTSRLEFRSVFRAPSRKFKILANPNVIVHGTSYEHSFTKNLNGHILYANRAQSQVSIGFSVEFRSVFRLPSQKFKILAIHDVLAHGKSYEHGLMKKRKGHKLCTKSRAESSFDRFFMHRLRNSKYWHSLRISPWEVVRAWFREKT